MMPVAPVVPNDNTTNMQIKIWEKADKDFSVRTEAYSAFKASLSSTVMGCWRVLSISTLGADQLVSADD